VQIGVITVGGFRIGTVSLTEGAPKPLESVPGIGFGLYTPMGRAEGRSAGDYDRPHTHRRPGQTYSGGSGGRPVRRPSAEVDAAISDAAKAYNLDPDTMRAVASVESSFNPNSNRDRRTQYKGLYQMGRDEWERFGDGGDIYNPRDNAMAAARMFDANRAKFRKNFDRDPTDTEMYLMHQQGLGFYTRGAMTNIGGNPYPGMRGPQTHDSFEEGWGRELARRKDAIKNPSAVPASGPTAGASADGGGVSANGVDPRIDEIVRAAATHLPEGYKVRMTSGYRGPHQHNHNGRAADYQIIDPSGNALRNRGDDPTGMYEQLARHAHGEQRARYPELNGHFAWGGAFDTSAGSGQRDLMHFDINGERGRYTDYQLRNLGPMPGVQYGKVATPSQSAVADKPFDPETMAP
jgi:hypothetical protein